MKSTAVHFDAQVMQVAELVVDRFRAVLFGLQSEVDPKNWTAL